jgi:membrane carboxypeptidase/penicillin-binding protein
MPARLLSQSLILKHRKARLQKQRKSGVKWFQRIGLAIIILLSLGVVTAGILLGYNYANLTSDLPSTSLLSILMNSETGQLLQPTHFYDRTGTKLIYTLENSGAERRFLKLDPALSNSFSPYLTQAAIGFYEPGFWKSSGYSWSQLTNPQPQTIAEHLVSDLLLWKEENSTRKAIRMRVLAGQVIRQFGRTDVLEWFLNSLNFGHQAWGAESAAQLYLGKSAHDLNLAEAAFLIGVAQSPALNPIDVPAEAQKFVQPVLEKLVANKAISEQEYSQALKETVLLKTQVKAVQNSALVLVNAILAQLTDTFPVNRLERGGLNVITTLDLDLQQQTECALQLQLARLQLKSYSAVLPDGKTCSATSTLPTYIGLRQPLSQDLTASALVVDPQSGEVLAMVGDSQLGGIGSTLHSHEPGSLLTPFVAVAGFARGLSPATLVWDIPARLPQAVADRGVAGTLYKGPMRLRTALNGDILNPIAQLLDQMGAADVWRYVEPFGFTGLSSVENPIDLIYQGGLISPLKLAQAYSVFANQGMIFGWDSRGDGVLSPVTTLTITDTEGNLFWQGMKPEIKTVLSAPLAYLVHDVLSDSSTQQTGMTGRNPLELDQPSAAKTGRVADGSQVWTVGYTPQRLSVVWIGISPSKDQRLDVQMAAGLWHAVMTQAQKNLTTQNWTQPAEITKQRVCDPSGLLPTTLCPNIVEEVFLTGEEPLAFDNLYQAVQVNRETGRLATVFTPLNLVDTHVYMVVPDDARQWAQSVGLPIPPTDYDTVQLPPKNSQVQITSPQNFVYIHGKVNIQGTAQSDQFKSLRVEVGQGINPQTWMLVSTEGTQPVQNGVLASWDTTGLDGLYAIRLIVLHNDQTFDTDIVQVTVDNTPPTVQLQYPQDGQQITRTNHVLLQANANDEIGVARVEWWMDEVKVGELTTSPFTMVWQSKTGTHHLFIRAFDAAGNMSQSDAITFEILP